MWSLQKRKRCFCVRYNPSAAPSAAPPLTQGRLGGCDVGSVDKKSLQAGGETPPLRNLDFVGLAGENLTIVGEDSISSRPDEKLLFLLLCQNPYPLFFAGRRRKEKLSKETPLRGREKGAF